ncbi:MAG: hypothetical protein ACXWDL_06915 [Nocardioides sp.]
MLLRRSLALATGALLLTAPLASCGFDPATNRVNTITPGTSDRDGTVDVLNAVIVSAEEGSGVFITTLVNNDLEDEASLDTITADDAEAVQVSEFPPVTVAANGLVNLAGDGQEGIPVEGEVAPGAVIPMTLQLSGGQVVRLKVPVVANCQEFAGIDGEGGECEVAEAEEH